MPGYEPFLLCDFHVHTQWSDGKLSVAEVVDLYGATGKFDVIAITDHILMKRDMLARAGRLATLGRRAFGVREEDFTAYLQDIEVQARRAWTTYGMLVVPGAEVTQNRLSGRKNSHIIALDIKRYVSADQPADAILKEIRRQGRSASPATRTTAPRAGSKSASVICGITATSWPIWWTYGRRQTVTTCFPSQASNTFPTWRTAISTSPSICTRGKRWCARRRPGRRSRMRCVRTSTLR